MEPDNTEQSPVEKQKTAEESLPEQHARAGNTPASDAEEHPWADPKTPVIKKEMPDEGIDPEVRTRDGREQQHVPASGEGENKDTL